MVYVLTSVYMLLFVFMIHYVINCTLLHIQLETRLYIFFVSSAFTSLNTVQDSVTCIMDPNVTAKVIEYLSKKGYSRTEAMLRMESANQDAEGRQLHSRAEESSGAKYGRAFGR